MAYKKRNINHTVVINNISTIFVVTPEGKTFQGYQKYLVSFKNGCEIHRYQTDATTRREIISYLENVLPSLFYEGTLKSTPSNWCNF